MPAFPPAHLIVVHPHLALAFQYRHLDWPAHAALAHQRGVRRRGWRVGQVRFQLRSLAQAAPQHQPLIWSWQAISHRYHAHKGEGGYERTLGALLYLIRAPAQFWI